MKRAKISLIVMSLLLMLLYGCGGGGGSSNNSDGVAALNNAPIAEAGDDQSVAVGETVVLSGSGSWDEDEDYPLTYEWQIVSTPEGSAASISEMVSIDGSDASQISISADLPGDYEIQLVVTDSKGLASEPDLVVVSTYNSAPKANAGPDQTVPINTTVTLDGSGSTDVDGDILNYSWSLTVPDGSNASLSNPTAVKPTFVVDASGTYIAQLIVNDSMLDSTPDTVTINWENSAPVANAGPDQTAQINDVVKLDGSGSSDVDGDGLVYSWLLITVPDGSNASLSDPAAASPTFVVDASGTYVAQLIVNDAMLDSAPDTVTINWENSSPIADAGPDQTAQINDLITLDGSGSFDADGDSLSFLWSLIAVPDGSSAMLSDPAIVNPTFDVDVAGTYVAQLIVNDGMVDSAPDTVTINWGNSPPVANAGPDQTAQVGDIVTLDGSGSSDVDGDSLSFFWSLIAVPDGSSTMLSNPAAVHPTFNVDVAGTYVAQLIVNDGMVDSEPDTVIINWENSAPVANAGPDQHFSSAGTTIQLDGSQSYDPDGDPLTYEWHIIIMPPKSSATLSDNATVNPTFVADSLGTYIVQLIVTDDSGASSEPAQVVVTSGNVRPVADAGVNQIVLVLNTAYLDGSGSYDANNDPLTYNWYFSSKPKKSLTELSDSTLVNPNFIPDIEGEFIVSLIVNDGSLDSHSSSVTILAVDGSNLDCFIQALWDALNAINSLDDSDFSNDNNRNALTNKIISFLLNYLKGSYGSNLVEVLQNDIGDKMDGCAMEQAPEETDWITNCPAQDKVYPYIELAIDIIENDPLCEQH
jgi:hypothetical protein